MDVDIDLTKTDPSRYDVVIMCAHYTSARSRYFEAPKDAPVDPMLVRTSPAVLLGGDHRGVFKVLRGFFLFLIDFCKPVLCHR